MNDNGDTLVEVLLATAVLAVVMASAFTLSNRATRLTQTANERSEVSNLMQAQAELLRANYSKSSAALWLTFDNHPTEGDLEVSPVRSDFCSFSVPAYTDLDNAFYMGEDLSVNLIGDDGSGNALDGVNDLYTIWIEMTNHNPSPPSRPVEYSDFIIYACWEGIGGETFQRSGLVVRLSRL